MQTEGKPIISKVKVRVKSAPTSKFAKTRGLLFLFSHAFWWGCVGICSVAHGQFGDVPMVVQEKCSACHLVPSPFEIPREGWPGTLKSMLPFMAEKALPITELEFNKIQDYYGFNSRETLFQIPDDLADTGLTFRAESIGELEVHARPQITSLKFADVDGDGKAREILVTDNLNHSISCLAHDGTMWREKILDRGASPVNTTPVDIDGDGDTDFAISLMGDIHPNDELIGAFHLLINQGDGKYARKVVLQGRVPRITDCAPADYDGDGDVDLVLAMFGWRKSGAFKVLEQTGPLSFTLRNIMEINGVMRVIPAHLNDDDRIDFLALVSQEHESIVRFINEGGLKFRNELITRSSPSFGTSSLFLEDLDQDGDQDILFTNGDMMDENPGAKPYHGVRWLENEKWVYQLRDLARMPGCYDAKPCDLDGDGDLDVVYSALYFQWKEHDFPSLAWLENLGGFRQFRPRKIAYAPTNLANIAVGDANGDGKLDIIGGGMHVPGPTDRASRLTLWLQK